MDRFRIKTPFCGTGSLENVALFIGFFYLLLSLAGISASFGYMATNSVYYATYYDVNFFSVLYGVSCTIWSVVNFFLLYGIAVKQRKFLLPWLQWHVVFTLVSIGELVWSSITVKNLLKEEEYYRFLTNSAIYLLSCVATYLFTVVYFMIVVYSLYCDISETENITSATNPFVKDRHAMASIAQQAAAMHRPQPSLSHQVANRPPASIPQQVTNRPPASIPQQVARSQSSIPHQAIPRDPPQRSVSHHVAREARPESLTSLQSAIIGKMKQMSLSSLEVTPDTTYNGALTSDEHCYEEVI